MAYRPPGRPTFSLRTQKINEIKAWLKREKPLWRARRETRNYHVTVLSHMFRVSRKLMMEIVQELANEYLGDDIKIEIKQETFYDAEGNPYTETVGIHINPPGSDSEGYWPWFPVARTVIEDAVTLALRGELLKRWKERPRLLRLLG